MFFPILIAFILLLLTNHRCLALLQYEIKATLNTKGGIYAQLRLTMLWRGKSCVNLNP